LVSAIDNCSYTILFDFLIEYSIERKLPLLPYSVADSTPKDIESCLLHLKNDVIDVKSTTILRLMRLFWKAIIPLHELDVALQFLFAGEISISRLDANKSRWYINKLLSQAALVVRCP
jgi:hypothetical protein